MYMKMNNICLSATGHFGCGKTMLAVEVVKIWMARFLEHNGTVEAFVLTFDEKYGLDYKLLNEELRSKFFQDQEESQVKVYQWQEFMTKFAQDHKKKLTQDQRNMLQKWIDHKHTEQGHVKSPI